MKPWDGLNLWTWRRSWIHITPALPSLVLSLVSPSAGQNSQIPLGLDVTSGVPLHGQNSGPQSITLPLEQKNDALGLPIFFTNITIGNPAQPFTLFLDLNYGGLAVRSTICETDCGRSWPAYDAARSTTAQDLKERFRRELPGHTMAGTIWKDDLQLMSSTVSSMDVGAVDTFYGESLVMIMLSKVSDGIIGLSPPNVSATPYPSSNRTSTPSTRPNFLWHLFDSDVVDHRTMMLRLPRHAGDNGELSFGSRSAHFDHSIPLLHASSPSKLENTWTVELTSISIAGSKNPSPLVLDLRLPAAMTLEPRTALYLPEAAVQKIAKHLGLEHYMSAEGLLVDCGKRRRLPNLAVMLGDQKIDLTFEDYSIVIPGPLGGVECYVAVQRLWFDDTYAMLGLPLLRKFNLHFDLDHRILGRESVLFSPIIVSL